MLEQFNGFRKAALLSVLLVTGSSALSATIVQSASGINCTSNCINGACTNTCTDQGSVLKGNGEVVVKEFDFAGFDIVFAKNIELALRHTDHYSLRVQADSNLLEKVQIRQTGKSLFISIADGVYENASIKAILGMPSLSKLELNSVQAAQVENFDQPGLSIALYGVSNLRGENNQIATLQHTASGVSTLDFSNSRIELAQLNVDGTSNIGLAFSRDGILTGMLRGVSTVRYCGRVDNQIQTYGIADVKRIDC